VYLNWRQGYFGAPIVTPRTQLPLAASTGVVAQITGLPGTTLRRLAKTDASFPKPFTINERGDLRWPVPEIVSWLEGKAGRPLQAA
jgi:predicted DNA-binding transcriptional regulator AlpA